MLSHAQNKILEMIAAGRALCAETLRTVCKFVEKGRRWLQVGSDACSTAKPQRADGSSKRPNLPEAMRVLSLDAVEVGPYEPDLRGGSSFARSRSGHDRFQQGTRLGVCGPRSLAKYDIRIRVVLRDAR